jgi:hypothetical protein
VRFLNEFRFFIDRDWLPIYLEISEPVQLERLQKLYPGFDPVVLEHASEIEIRQMNPPPESRFDATLPLNIMLQQIGAYLNEESTRN